VEGIAMEMAEIRKRYRNEWVLIEYTKLDDELNVVEGVVITHSKDREEIHKAQMELKNKKLAIEYLGEIPEEEDLVVVF
jgi:hypothetical protein